MFVYHPLATGLVIVHAPHMRMGITTIRPPAPLSQPLLIHVTSRNSDRRPRPLTSKLLALTRLTNPSTVTLTRPRGMVANTLMMMMTLISISQNVLLAHAPAVVLALLLALANFFILCSLSYLEGFLPSVYLSCPGGT